jgi:hypothetical protein
VEFKIPKRERASDEAISQGDDVADMSVMHEACENGECKLPPDWSPGTPHTWVPEPTLTPVPAQKDGHQKHVMNGANRMEKAIDREVKKNTLARDKIDADLNHVYKAALTMSLLGPAMWMPAAIVAGGAWVGKKINHWRYNVSNEYLDEAKASVAICKEYEQNEKDRVQEAGKKLEEVSRYLYMFENTDKVAVRVVKILLAHTLLPFEIYAGWKELHHDITGHGDKKSRIKDFQECFEGGRHELVKHHPIFKPSRNTPTT